MSYSIFKNLANVLQKIFQQIPEKNSSCCGVGRVLLWEEIKNKQSSLFSPIKLSFKNINQFRVYPVKTCDSKNNEVLKLYTTYFKVFSTSESTTRRNVHWKDIFLATCFCIIRFKLQKLLTHNIFKHIAK